MGGVWLALGVVAVTALLAFTDAESGMRTWWALRDDLRAAHERIDSLRAEVAAVEHDSGGLEGKGEPFALERAIRERLLYARPDETIVRLTAPAPGDGSPRIP
jgi:cell division protein FtsB